MAGAPLPTLSVTPDFHESYIDFATYPCNSKLELEYSDVLETQRSRLNKTTEYLLTDPLNPAHRPTNPDEPKIEIVFRDWHHDNRRFFKWRVDNEGALRSWLGEQTPSAATALVDLTKPDPKCRFIFLYSETSRSRLKLSRDMLCRLLTHHQVMPQYLDFISVFGAKTEPNDLTFSGRDLRFSGFQVQNAACRRTSAQPALGRSGRSFQICYNLKTVAEKSTDTWSIRQAAFHHQFDIESGNALWISTKPGLDDIKKRVQQLTGSTGRVEDRSFNNSFECFRSSLAIHLMYCQWSTEDWRWYIEYLERRIENESLKIVVAPQSAASGAHMLSSRNLQILQHDTDRTNEAIMLIERNIDIMNRLKVFYQSLLLNSNFMAAFSAPTTTSPVTGQSNLAQTIDPKIVEVVTLFSAQLDSMSSGMSMHVSRAKLLVQIARDRNTLILQHMQSQSTEKMQALTLLSHREAIVMRIITVVTLIFLPATFVSTFFSTDVVKYQDPNGFSLVGLERWLQVTLPLTFVTLGLGMLAYRYAKVKAERELLPYHNEKMV